MGKENILLFGASDHARSTIDIVEQEARFHIVGILDFGKKINTEFAGYEILGTDDDLTDIISSYNVGSGIVTIGDNNTRRKVVNKIVTKHIGFKFVTAVHPSAIIGKNTTIGDGSVLMAGTIINNDSKIGEHCYVGCNASVDHDSILGNFSSVGPGVTTGGTIMIGNCSAVGIGANILHGRVIGHDTIIGAGSLVVQDIGDLVVAYGSPAKEIRKRNQGDPYL